jgi:hypothetical protein
MGGLEGRKTKILGRLKRLRMLGVQRMLRRFNGILGSFSRFWRRKNTETIAAKS